MRSLAPLPESDAASSTTPTAPEMPIPTSLAAKKANSGRSGDEKQAMEITVDCLRSHVVTMQVEQRGGAAVVLALQKQLENAWAGHSGHSAWGPPHVPNLEMGGDKSNCQAGYHSYWPETGGPGGSRP